MCHTSSGLFVKCLRERQSQPGVTSSVSLFTIPRKCLLYSSSKERDRLHILYFFSSLVSYLSSTVSCLFSPILLTLDDVRVWEYWQHVQVVCVAVFPDICFLEGGNIFLADIVARATFTCIQQVNQDQQQQQQYIRQPFYPLPIYHFLLPFSSPPFFSTVRYTIVCVRTQQEVTQSGTSIHKQAPVFYWITS